MLRATLAKRLGAFALDVTLDVAAGHTLALVGESGAGKTTVLRLLAGLGIPDSGRIDVGDVCYHDATGMRVAAWDRSVGFVPQDSSLFPHLTARDNVAFGLRAAGVPRPARDQRVGEIIERLGIVPFADRRPRQLSGGQQQRVALARALVLEPELLLLDEPLSALDTASRHALRDELIAVLSGRAGVTILVTHSMEEAHAVAGDEIRRMVDGRLRLPE